MKRFEEIVLSANNYETREELWKALSDTVKILLDNGYTMTIRYDEPGLGIICINYNYADEDYGCPYPYWLTPEEVDRLYHTISDFDANEYSLENSETKAE